MTDSTKGSALESTLAEGRGAESLTIEIERQAGRIVAGAMSADLEATGLPDTDLLRGALRGCVAAVQGALIRRGVASDAHRLHLIVSGAIALGRALAELDEARRRSKAGGKEGDKRKARKDGIDALARLKGSASQLSGGNERKARAIRSARKGLGLTTVRK